MIRQIALGLALCALLACSPASTETATSGDAAAQTAPDAAPAGAEDAIMAWARERYGVNLIEPVAISYGDFSGDGAPDALVWADYSGGGSSAMHDVALFRNQDGRMVFWRTDETVYGSQPRDVQIARGSITLTTTMPRPGDAHCCPTGSESWTIDAH